MFKVTEKIKDAYCRKISKLSNVTLILIVVFSFIMLLSMNWLRQGLVPKEYQGIVFMLIIGPIIYILCIPILELAKRCDIKLQEKQWKVLKNEFSGEKTREVQIIAENDKILENFLSTLDSLEVKHIATIDNDDIVISAVDKYGIPIENSELRIMDPSFFEKHYKLI